MEKLTEIVQWAEKDNQNRLEIFDPITEGVIEKCVTAEWATEKFGSLEGYFTHLLQKGINKIAVQPMRKRGNTQVRQGLLKTFALSEKARDVERGGAAQAPATQQPQQTAPTPQQMPAMNGAMQGLGYAEISKIATYDDIKRDRDDLREELKSEKADNKRLERENLKYELGIEGKPGALDRLLETISEKPEILGMVTEAIMKKKAGSMEGQPALNAPETSALKADIISVLTNPSVTDEVAQAAYQVIFHALNGNKKFMADYNKLMQQHSSKQNENGTS